MGASASTAKHHMGIMHELAESWRKFYHHHFHHEKANEALKKEEQSPNPDPNKLVAASQMAGEAQRGRDQAAAEISGKHARLVEAVGKEKADEGNKIAKEAGKKAAETGTDANGNATKPIELKTEVQNALRLKLQFA